MKVTNRLVSVRAKTVITAVLVVSSCVDFVKGGCLSYGHSCWGGHGKRSGAPGGRSSIAVRTIPAPPLYSQDTGLWPSIERGQTPVEYKSAMHYQPLNRLFRIPPAAAMDLLGSDAAGSSSASDENDSENLKAPPDDKDSVYETLPPRPRIINARENQFRLRKHLRQKAALLQTMADGTEPSNDSDDNDDFGQLVLNVGDRGRNDNSASLSNPGSPRKYSRSS
ncbi:uncharacterized protein LOC129718956 isoform X2 [Wyeomyia smithii]|uniref:uncharacterized protein LOC129718956 isoform X2 n=1 Tax=Wyeomyia smithii TaxID=174621 RepID=UPI002467AD0C|nr:uncharacterized protein LOC129718956 isoform X2 [Wyeomyia smithii]